MKRTEIRRHIGELLGYRVEVTSFYGPTRYKLTCPQGDSSPTCRSEKEAWEWLPRFDEDMAEAWRVVEFMHKQEDELLDDFIWHFDQADLWGFTAQEAALEICLMALQASGVEVGEVEEGE